MSTQPSASNGAVQANAQGQVTAAPFRRGTQPTVLNTGYVQTITMTTAAQDLPQWQIPPSNILRCIYIEVVATASSNAATVAFQGDAPLNALSTVNFADAGGTSIVGSFDSFTLAMVQKYGGYSTGSNADPRANASYTTTVGAVGAGGSFTEVLRIPVEVVSRTGVGSLQNQSTNQPLTLSLTLNASGKIYSTAPTTLPSVTVTGRLGGYWKGDNATAMQAPTAYGTTSYWNRASYLALNGSVTQQLQNIGLGNPVRNLMFLNYTTGGARSDSNFPTSIELDFRGNKLFNMDQTTWKFLMSEAYGLATFATASGVYSSTLDTGLGLDTGVYVVPFNRDFAFEPGNETGNGYLMTNLGDQIQLVGTWNASCSLYEVINFLAVNGPVTQIQAGA